MTEHWSCDCRPGIEETIAIGRAVGHRMTHFVAYRHGVSINSCLKVSPVIRICLTNKIITVFATHLRNSNLKPLRTLAVMGVRA